MLTLGQKKVVYGACEQESEKNFKNVDFENAKFDLCKQKFLEQKKPFRNSPSYSYICKDLRNISEVVQTIVLFCL